MKSNLLFLFILLTQFVLAQNFTESPQSPPFEGVGLSSIAFADVDGDFDQDVLITGTNNNTGAPISKLYTNDGRGNFTEVIDNPFEDVGFSSIAFADVDRDSDQDVLITGTNRGTTISKLYTNDGEGNFTEMISSPLEGVHNSSIAFADVDGDSDQDVLITGTNNTGARISKLYTNDGEGNFTEVTGTPFEEVNTSSIAFADVDGDLDQDVLITGENSSFVSISILYINDGRGNFTEMSGSPFEGVDVGSIAFADVDGDSDQDVLITGQAGLGPQISILYTNDGRGNFTEVTDTPFEGVGGSSIAFTDVDGDFDQDVLISGRNGSGVAISKLYINDGRGNFTEVADTSFEGVQLPSIAFADVDGDLDQDVLVTGVNNSLVSISKLYTNDRVSSSTDFLIKTDLNLTLSPNPALSNKLNVSFNSTLSNSVIVRVYDLNGHLISQQNEFVLKGEQTLLVDISSLPTGSYFIQLENDKKLGVAKFIVQ